MSSVIFVVLFVVVFVISFVIVTSELLVACLTGVTIPYVSKVTIRNTAIPINCKNCSFFIFCYE